jgi:hypothetical protein
MRLKTKNELFSKMFFNSPPYICFWNQIGFRMLENGHNQAQTRLEMHIGGWISTLWLDHYVRARVLEDQTKVKFKVIKVRLRSSLDSGASMQSFFGELSFWFLWTQFHDESFGFIRSRVSRGPNRPVPKEH